MFSPMISPVFSPVFSPMFSPMFSAVFSPVFSPVLSPVYSPVCSLVWFSYPEFHYPKSGCLNSAQIMLYLSKTMLVRQLPATSRTWRRCIGCNNKMFKYIELTTYMHGSTIGTSLTCIPKKRFWPSSHTWQTLIRIFEQKYFTHDKHFFNDLLHKYFTHTKRNMIC